MTPGKPNNREENGTLTVRLTTGNWIALASLLVVQAGLVVGGWTALRERIVRLETNQIAILGTQKQMQATQATIARTANSTAQLVDYLKDEIRQRRGHGDNQ